MRRMEEYLSAAEPRTGNDERAMFVRDRMTPARPFASVEAQSFLGRIVYRALLWHAKRQSRLSLYDMSAEQLEDIGLSRAEVEEERRKGALIALEALGLSNRL